MSTKKPHIAQIDKYLKGELDTRAMHKLEREAQDDPFFAEAMEGFEGADNNQQANLADLQARLAARIAPAKERSIWVWRVLPLAACLLIALLVGYWYLTPKISNKQFADNLTKQVAQPQVTQPDKTVNKPDVIEQPNVKPVPVKPKPEEVAATPPAEIAPSQLDNAVAKAHTELKGPDTSIFMRKSIVYNDTAVSKALAGKIAGVQVRVNGKDFVGGNVQQAAKSLPSGIVTKIQVTDDRNNQASQKNKELKQVNIAGGADTVKNHIAANNAIANRVVTGKVVSKDDGEPLIGATVKTSDGTQKAITNIEGTFSISVPANSTLSASYIGFNSQNINAAPDNVKIELQPSTSSLSEVVVVGYGTQTRRDITGSVSQVAAQPIGGTKAYDDYLKKNAVTPNGETGTIKIAFTVAANGKPENIYVVSGKSKALNEKAVQLIENGPRWIKGTDNKEIRLKIKFHK